VAPSFAPPAFAPPARTVSSAPAAATAVAAAPAAVAEAEPELSPELESRWRDVLAGINGRKRMLGAFLEACRFVGCRGDEVLLGMDDLRRVVVEEQENRALIGEEIRRAFGDTRLLRCVTGVASPARTAVDEVKPLVDQAIAWFEGEAVERPASREERTRR
jgi:hypothetical protein